MKLILENFKQALKEQEGDAEIAAYVKNQDLGLEQYTALLKKIASDPEFRKLAMSGHTDTGGPPDEALTVEEGSPVAAKDLTPTQKDIDFDKSFGDQMVNKWDPPSTEAALSTGTILMPSPGGAIPVLTFKNKYILDGHHRWSQVMMTNPEGKMAVSNLAGVALKSEEAALKATQLAIAALAGNVVTKDTKVNLLGVEEDYVKNYVMKNITDEVLQLLTKAGKIAKPDKRLAAEYYAGNLAAIKAKPAGKFARVKGMPQADDSGVKQAKVNQALEKGIINFDDAAPSDLKENKKLTRSLLKKLIKEEISRLKSKEAK